MSYTSWIYYAMVLVLLVIYYILPKRNRWISLLVGSVFFCYQLLSNYKQLFIFFYAVFFSFFAGITIEKLRRTKNNTLKKTALIMSVLLTALPLVLEKIGNLLCESALNVNYPTWIIPIGLSFYTLQLIAYIIDIYNGKIEAQHNFFKHLLFVSFFPQIIQGPIPRYEKLNRELFDGNDYDSNNIIAGIQLVIWGFFLKYMIADKAAIIVNTVFDHYHAYSGGYIWFAAILYSIQLYTDFLSCTTISQGVAEMFGIHLENNFLHPYFATSVKDFWRRWHISLSSWLRDYIYIPLGGNRKGNFRKWLYIFITFVISGIWHGGSWKYLVWGMLHAIYQIIGEIKDYTINKKKGVLEKKSSLSVVFQRIFTFILVMIAWIVFRAENTTAAIEMIYTMLVGCNPWIWFDDAILRLGLNWKECFILFTAIVVLYWVSYYQEKRYKIRQWISNQNIIVRWGIYLIAIWTIWICGSYGYGFDSKDFIYGGF